MISVCMTTYNGEKYVREQLDSILNQLSEEDELIISDDGSSDSTVSIINSFKDKRIILKQSNFKNYSLNFENAIKDAQGDYIFLSDQDDVWVSNKVQLFLNELQNSDLVVSDVIIVDENLNVIHDSHFKLYKVEKGFLINFSKTRYIGASMAFNRNVLSKVLPFPKRTNFCAYDYWIAIISEFYFKVSLIRTPTMYYRRHNNNASTGGLKSPFSLSRQIMTRFYSLFMLILRILK